MKFTIRNALCQRTLTNELHFTGNTICILLCQEYNDSLNDCSSKMYIERGRFTR